MYGNYYPPVPHQLYPSITFRIATSNFPNPTYVNPPISLSEAPSLAAKISQHYPVLAIEVVILLSPNYIMPNPTIYPVCCAMDMLRKANAHPHALPRYRQDALNRILHPLVSGNNTIYQFSARGITAAVFNDLDTALFDGMLYRRVYIGDGQISELLLGCMSNKSLRGVQIDISTEYFDDKMRGQAIGYRVQKLIEVLVHEMCHAFLPALCAPGNMVADYDIRGADVPDGHGVYFGETLGLVQKIFDCQSLPMDMSNDGRYQLYEMDN